MSSAPCNAEEYGRAYPGLLFRKGKPLQTRIMIVPVALAASLAFSCGPDTAVQAAPATAAAQQVRPPVSPVVHPDRTVTFSVIAPES
jgi:hypothetical protein